MAPFKDEQILIIAPGSRTTLAQLGLPESLTPARFRVRSCMFPAEKPGEFEPNKVRRKDVPPADGDAEPEYEEDVLSEQGAIWPIQQGRIVDWDCFFALIDNVYRNINPPFHTAILLIAQPIWTPKEHEKIAQFIFEKLKPPAFGLMDAASATLYAYGVPTATIVDVGYEKADVTAIYDYLTHDTGRALSVPGCGGEALTERLFQLLSSRGFSKEVCEQLKKSPICEILDGDLPTETAAPPSDQPSNPAAAASTGAEGSGPDQRTTTAALGETPLGPGPGTQVGSEQKDGEDNEGVLDIASIVTGGNMNEFLERKEKEKAERLAAKKKGTEAGPVGAKPVRLPNSKRVKNTFIYEDHVLRDAMKQQNYSDKQIADMQAAVDVGPAKKNDVDAGDADRPTTDGPQDEQQSHGGAIRREAEVGIERFQAASGGVLDRLADVIYRTVSSVEEVGKRSELWDSLIIVGNGSKVRGFKEALLNTLQTKYLISPSSATIFTSELPSNLSTPMATGANTPQPSIPPHLSSGVNPLLYAATTAQNPQLNPMNGGMPGAHMPHSLHSSHAQSPTSVKLAKMPEYFPEWKDAGYEEAVFLGAQVAAKVLFMVDQGLSKGYMTRTDYNEQGPQGIHDCSM
ncbi:actin-like ATPase domain-containing protein [Aureobasidium sp. EXF-12298]